MEHGGSLGDDDLDPGDQRVFSIKNIKTGEGTLNFSLMGSQPTNRWRETPDRSNTPKHMAWRSTTKRVRALSRVIMHEVLQGDRSLEKPDNPQFSLQHLRLW